MLDLLSSSAATPHAPALRLIEGAAEGRPLRVNVAGGGPVGLAFALTLDSLLGDRVQITIFDSRWTDADDGLRWKTEQEGNARRGQVVTLQSDMLRELPADLQAAVMDEASVMWPHGRASPPEWGPPRNIRISALEDHLMALATARRIILEPRPFVAGTTNLAGVDVLAVCEGARSSTREHFADRFGRGDPSVYSFNGRCFEDVVLALGVRSTMPSAEAVLMTVSQNRFLLNTHNGEGILNIRLTPGEASELRASNPVTGAMSGCMRAQSCTMKRLFAVGGATCFACRTHGCLLRPPLDRRSLLWPRIREGLALFGIAEADVSSVTATRVSMVHRPRFSAELLPAAPGRPATFGFLLGDAANAIHHWPGRGLNSGMLSAISLARCLAARRAGPPLRHADFARHEGNMQMLQYRHKARAWAAMARTGPSGRQYPIADDIRAGFMSRRKRTDLAADMMARLVETRSRLRGRIEGLPDDDGLQALVDRMGDETLSVCVSSGAWDTFAVGGAEIDIALMLPPQERARAADGNARAA